MNCSLIGRKVCLRNLHVFKKSVYIWCQCIDDRIARGSKLLNQHFVTPLMISAATVPPLASSFSVLFVDVQTYLLLMRKKCIRASQRHVLGVHGERRTIAKSFFFKLCRLNQVTTATQLVMWLQFIHSSWFIRLSADRFPVRIYTSKSRKMNNRWMKYLLPSIQCSCHENKDSAMKGRFPVTAL